MDTTAWIGFFGSIIALGGWVSGLSSDSALQALHDEQISRFRVHQCRLAAALLGLLIFIMPAWLSVDAIVRAAPTRPEEAPA